jgi:hypothetical protein
MVYYHASFVTPPPDKLAAIVRILRHFMGGGPAEALEGEGQEVLVGIPAPALTVVGLA